MSIYWLVHGLTVRVRRHLRPRLEPKKPAEDLSRSGNAHKRIVDRKGQVDR